MIQKAPIEEDLVGFDEFCTLVADGQKADLIDGVIYMASPDTTRSNALTGLIYYLFEGFTAARDIGGFSFVTRFACKFTDTRAPEPDVGYVQPERLHLVKEGYVDGGPDIAVEIVSRDSRSRDYGEKRELYEAAGVLEYWIVDPLQRRVEFLRLVSGKYVLIPLEENRIFRSEAIPGLWINIEWLLAKPTPKAYHCLQEILRTPS
ncbi:MAG: Uma2 family endonuclease [Pirellulaceae bacterium]|nr:Uma2 family endonuclease [Pirellulaceae bacterium]